MKMLAVLILCRSRSVFALHGRDGLEQADWKLYGRIACYHDSFSPLRDANSFRGSVKRPVVEC